jgi:hypothetical protein
VVDCSPLRDQTIVSNRSEQAFNVTEHDTVMHVRGVCVRTSPSVQTGSGATQLYLYIGRVPRALSTGGVTLYIVHSMHD